MKKFLIVALIMTIALVATFAPSGNVYAETNTISAKVLNNNKNTLYHVFYSPTDIFYAGDGLYIATEDGCEVYTDNSNGKAITSTDIVADDFAYLYGLITLKDGNIYYNGNSIEGSFTAITANGNSLFAIANNNIHKFDYDSGTLTESEIFSHTANVGKISATENGYAYSALSTDGYTNIIYVNDKRFADIPKEEILDLEYDNGRIFVLTPSSVILYTDEYSDPISYKIEGAKKFTVGDRVYVLTRTGNIESISLDLAPSTAMTVIAASSDSDWFYSSPVGGSTRLGKIYIADRALGRVAVINGTSIGYLTGLRQPLAVTADNTGKVYVAHYGNRVAIFTDGKLTSDNVMADETIIDLQVDYNNNLYLLTESGNVIDNTDTIIRRNVKAFDFQNGFNYMTEDYVCDTPIQATDFCTDIAGNIFCVSGNTITSIIDGETTTYTIENAAHICAVTMSKVESEIISYGDLILFDDTNKCVLTVDGSLVGSVNVKDLYSQPDLINEPNERTDGIVGVANRETYMFSLPIEGEISYVIDSGDNVIICKDVPAPEPFVYCLCDDTATKTLKSGYIYASNITILQYISPKNTEAKVNADNTPIYKYPTIYSPVITNYSKDKMVTILPFAVNYHDDYGDGWYSDAYSNKWYRIAYGEKEGYILTADTNVNFFSDEALPKTNATIIENATLYRIDENGEYVPFEAAGLYIAKDTRVAVEIPFDTSRQYTKIVFYREGYGTIDAECYVRTEYIKFDGVDIIKIIAIAVIIVALITLTLVIIRKSRLNKKSERRQIDMK